jgi:translation initiation factor IF-3
MAAFIVGYFNRYNIDQHDYSVRLKAARKFLADGDKVTLIILTWHIKHTYSIYHLQVY